MDKFRVGQKVRIIAKESIRFGETCTIVSPKKFSKVLDFDNSVIECFNYRVDLPKSKDNKYIVYEEKNLEPVYDGDEKSTWSECAWKPKELTKT